MSSNKHSLTKEQKYPLKIAIVAELLVKMGGAERVVKRLTELFPQADLYTLLYDEEKCGKLFPANQVKSSFLQKLPRWLRKRYRWLLSLMPYAVESLDLSDYDLVISSSSAFAHGALTGSESVHICYCHSPMRYAWDYAHEYLKQKWFGPLKKLLAFRSLEKIRIWDRIVADRPDFYIANSAHVANRIEKYYRLPSQVIYPPVNTKKFAQAESGKDQHKLGEYFLIVSALTAFKKVDLAISLFNKVGKKLVIIGDGIEREYLESIAGDNINFLGRLDDDDVAAWMSGCKALIFPSEEDFGITMVEAQAAGKPVLALASGGAMEIIESGVSGELFSEDTLEAMEDGLGRLIVNLPNYNRSNLKKLAERFNQEQFDNYFLKFVKEKTKNL